MSKSEVRYYQGEGRVVFCVHDQNGVASEDLTRQLLSYACCDLKEYEVEFESESDQLPYVLKSKSPKGVVDIFSQWARIQQCTLQKADRADFYKKTPELEVPSPSN